MKQCAHDAYQSARFPFVLSLLFFAKYNYWMVMVVALLLFEGWNRRTEIASLARDANWKKWLAIALPQFTQLCNLPLGLLSIYYLATELTQAMVSINTEGRPRNENLNSLHLSFGII